MTGFWNIIHQETVFRLILFAKISGVSIQTVAAMTENTECLWFLYHGFVRFNFRYIKRNNDILCDLFEQKPGQLTIKLSLKSFERFDNKAHSF